MVLINELTVEQINAALLHLQRSKDEVVGGNKGTTIQNITISNSGGGGNNVDYSGTIKNLATNIEKNKTAIEKNASDVAKLKSDFSNIEKSVEDTLEGLVDNGISDLSFDPLTKQLTITTNDGDIYQTVIEQDIGYLSYDSATNKLTLTTGNQTQEITLPYIKTSEKGSANGVATLDENGRVPYSQLPESAMEFLGQWDASTNTPHLADGTGTNGDFYIVSAGGTVNLGTAQDPHIVTFSINDRIVYEGDIAQWVRLPAGQVSSVNGQSGEVTLTASDIEYSTGVSIKAKIDANAVQSDWNVSDTTSLAYIKNKPTIPASPVQSDWNVTDTTSLAYIKNKPTIPSTPTLVCCAECVYLDAFTGCADRSVMLAYPRGTTGYSCQGVSTNCPLTFNPYTGVLCSCCLCGTSSRTKFLSGNENNVSIDWRAGNASYHTTTSYQTAGNEALVFATKSDCTSFIFVNGEDSLTNHASNRWTKLIPGLQIKCNKVSINKLIADGVAPTYELEVNGTVCAAGFCGTATCATHATCADHASSADVGELSWTSCGCGVYVSGCFVRAEFYQDEDKCIYWALRCFAQVVNRRSDVATPRRTSVVGFYCCTSGSEENHNFALTALEVTSSAAYLYCSWSSSGYLKFCCSSSSIKNLTNFKLLAIR